MQVYTNLNKGYRIWISLLIGIIVGIMGSIVRIGWEVLFPLHLKTPLSTQAQYLLQILHINTDAIQLNYIFSNGYEWNLLYLAWQFGFSVIFGICYVMIAEFWLKLKFAHGIFFGIGLWFCIYALLLPLCGFVETNTDSIIFYYIVSFIEAILWIWIVELTRRDLRNRITQERDPF